MGYVNGVNSVFYTLKSASSLSLPAAAASRQREQVRRLTSATSSRGAAAAAAAAVNRRRRLHSMMMRGGGVMRVGGATSLSMVAFGGRSCSDDPLILRRATEPWLGHEIFIKRKKMAPKGPKRRL